MTGSECVDGILQQMARVLNSNENFEMNDSFQLLFTQMRGHPVEVVSIMTSSRLSQDSLQQVISAIAV